MVFSMVSPCFLQIFPRFSHGFSVPSRFVLREVILQGHRKGGDEFHRAALPGNPWLEMDCNYKIILVIINGIYDYIITILINIHNLAINDIDNLASNDMDFINGTYDYMTTMICVEYLPTFDFDYGLWLTVDGLCYIHI